MFLFPRLPPAASRPIVVLLIAVAGASLGVACRATPAPRAATPVSADTWATVDGRQITRDDVERSFGRSRDVSQPLPEEEALAAKLTILDELIVQDLLLAKATALKLEIPAADLDTAFNNAKNNISDEAFQQELTKRGLTAVDMREGLRRDMLAQKVLEQEVGSKVAVADADVNSFYAANRAQFNIPEEAYHIAQIVVTPVREARISNGSGDDATSPEAANAKIKMLMERLKAGAAFAQLAAAYSEDPESASRGGDLGLVPISRLKAAPPALRNAVLDKTPGTVNVVSAGGAHTVVLVVAHELAGQRDLSTPGLKERITETLRGPKEQLLRTAYLTTVRSDAAVVNYLARRIVESNGRPPAAAPAALIKK
ncbi:MAG: peptidylprolyl isomerase [Vicinamibacterales bacterium]